MNTGIVETALIGRVLDGSETNDAVTVQVDDERIVRCHCHVQTQIALIKITSTCQLKHNSRSNI